MTGKPSLLKHVRRSLRLKHYSIRTERAYVEWVKHFILYHGERHPAGMGVDEFRQFLSHLAGDRSVAAATRNQALGATLPLPRGARGGVALRGRHRARQAPGARLRRPPRDEADSILSRMTGAYRLMASLLYGSGLRLVECVRLRVKNLDFGYRQITVRDGKGEKDRRTVLPESLVEPLGRHLGRVRLLHGDSGDPPPTTATSADTSPVGAGWAGSGVVAS